MQKWARLNIRRQRNPTARQEVSDAEHLPAQVKVEAEAHDHQEAHQEVCRRKIKSSIAGKTAFRRRKVKK